MFLARVISRGAFLKARFGVKRHPEASRSLGRASAAIRDSERDIGLRTKWAPRGSAFFWQAQSNTAIPKLEIKRSRVAPPVAAIPSEQGNIREFLNFSPIRPRFKGGCGLFPMRYQSVTKESLFATEQRIFWHEQGIRPPDQGIY